MGLTSWWHWAIVLVVLVLLFGSKKLPDAARGLGQSLRIFKSEVQEMQKDGETRPTAAEPVPPRELPTSSQTPPHDPATPKAPADNTKKPA
ncbi:Sec-independent protein translocase subunit TatA [Gordonia oryzae]|uniref:Sec-independent protein translocase protein TatA n=1 Tax=Gordonia oryzae TaxID=2487349 RepID=A0A3N4GVA9_9ACTN|nr:Sec-independent protein translocase subunit TatA [Gordonia oryzae]RPA66275.1 Sec-independent protein translocase subunit TatA [Gordonia oryzae]